MYSWVINNLMERYNHNLPSNVYLDMTKNSPQISQVTYNAYDNSFEVKDDEGSCWLFEVHYQIELDEAA